MSERKAHWSIEPETLFLNHGSFGACPRVVQETQASLRARMERNPVRFLARELEAELDHTRALIAPRFGANAEDLAFVRNASEGVNTVLRSLTFAPGDELLTTDHAYNACKNALDFVASRSGAKVVVAKIPFAIDDPSQAEDAVLAAVTPRTRLALLDWVTSPTALVLPIERLVSALSELGVDSLIDGAHAPGMIPLSLDLLGAAYFTGNAHKWLCAPKGAALLHVRRDRQHLIRPLVISHGANDPRSHRSRFRLEHDWCGTFDPTAVLTIPRAIAFLESLCPDKMQGVMDHNQALALQARAVLCERLGLAECAPPSMIGSMATVILPPRKGARISEGPLPLDPLHEELARESNIEVPVFVFGEQNHRCLRVSAQWYNSLDEYHKLAEVLATKLDVRNA
ncbi:MAG: aminotransferase class V-fold PLP-dependent enzyme [Deltaproteobacteria bacterium]|nr:aminotransferase class V-fold PLP-dependent enzyme [Deltaproteobacteria bacterium]